MAGGGETLCQQWNPRRKGLAAWLPSDGPAGLWTTQLLSPALAREMLEYQSEEIYGLGVALAQRGHPKRLWHSGANGNYKCLFEAFAETGQGLVIMTNGENGLRLIGEIQRAVAQEYRWPDGRQQEHAVVKLDSASLHTFTGVYLLGGLFKFKVTEKSGKLYVQYAVFGDQPLELLPESETRFFTTAAPFVIEFRRETDGSVKGAKAWHGAEELEGEKVADIAE
jgi:hypothetical protein